MTEYQKERINSLFQAEKNRERNALDYLREPDPCDVKRAERMNGVMMEATGFLNGMINTLMALGYAIKYDEDGNPQVV